MNNSMDKNELKEKVIDYASKVFFYCIKRCNSRMDAEDLSQIILLEVIQNINKGAQIDNFDYYIWGVCKNQYNMYLRKTIKDKNNIILVEEIAEKDNSKSVLDEMLEDEKIRQMNQAIKLLNKDYAEILYAFYVEDKTLKFIAEELSLPLGTVKKRLFIIRRKIKEYLEMEKLNGRKAYVPKNFSGCLACTDTLGFDIHAETSPLLVKNLLYHSYDNPCSLEDYAIELGISISYVEDYVKKLVNMQLLKKTASGKYLTTIAFIDRDMRRKVLDMVRENIGEYQKTVIKYAKEHILEYKALLDNQSIDDKLLMWTLIFEIINNSSHSGKMKYTKATKLADWDFLMSENIDKLYDDEFFISNNICRARYYCINVHLASVNEDTNKVGKRIKEGKSATGYSENSAVFDYIIGNTINFNDLEPDFAEELKKYIDLGYFRLENNLIKVNVPVFNENDFNQFMAKVREDNELKDAFLKMYNSVKAVLEKIIPEYLKEQSEFIFMCSVNTIKSLVISYAYQEGLLSFGNNENYFVYNMYILKNIK